MTSFKDRKPVDIATSAADELRRLARYADRSQEQLASEMGISRQAMNTKLNGGPLDLTEFVAIALSLGRNPSESFRRLSNRRSPKHESKGESEMRKMKRSDVREWIPGEPLERVDFGNGCTGMDKSIP